MRRAHFYLPRSFYLPRFTTPSLLYLFQFPVRVHARTHVRRTAVPSSFTVTLPHVRLPTLPVRLPQFRDPTCPRLPQFYPTTRAQLFSSTTQFPPQFC